MKILFSFQSERDNRQHSVIGDPEAIWELYMEVSTTQRWSDFDWFKCELVSPSLTMERITLQELEELASQHE